MFKFKGISSEDMQVVIEEEEHFLARAGQRYEVTEIEGRDGAIFDELGYSYVERPIYVQCLNVDKIDDILAWLNGEGELEYKGRVTTARFYSQLEPQRQACIRIIDANFIRNPFWHKANDAYEVIKPEDTYVTVEGSNIHIEDSADWFAKVNVCGKSEQETREGYNLLKEEYRQGNYNDETSTTKVCAINGIECKNGEQYLATCNNQNYEMYLCVSENNERIFDIKQWGSWTASKKSYECANDGYLRLIIRKADESNITVKEVEQLEIMIVSGTQEKSYEKHGKTPSFEFESPVESVAGDIEVEFCNHNLFDESALTNVTNGTVADKIVTTSTLTSTNRNVIVYCSVPLSIKANKTYYISADIRLKSGMYDNQMGTINFLDIGSMTSKIIQNQKITSEFQRFVWEKSNVLEDAETNRLLMQFANTNITDAVFEIKNIMVSTENTDYTPHQSQTYPLYLDKELHGNETARDSIVKKDSKWCYEFNWYKYVFTGNEVSIRQSVYNEIYQYDFTMSYLVQSKNDTIIRAKSNYLKGVAWNNSWQIDESITPKLNENVIRITTSKYRTIEDLKAFMAEKYASGEPVYAVYMLKEPSYEEITDSTLIAQLDALEKAYTYKNITNIQSNAHLEVTYKKDLQYIVKNIGNVASRPILKLIRLDDDEVDIAINNIRFKYNFNGEKYVLIDCEEKEVKYEGLNRNRQIEIDYEFPNFNVGNNEIILYSGGCIVEAIRKDRWL